jgi:hypothetical protein
MKQTHAVFAYGSNMDLDDLARWLGERGHAALAPSAVEVGVLEHHRLVWNYRSPSRAGGAANVQRADGEHLPGIVLDVDDALLTALDVKEGHPQRYARALRDVRASPSGAPRSAWVYEVTDAWRLDEDVWPRRAYLDVVLRGARFHGLPLEHLDALAATPTVD